MHPELEKLFAAARALDPEAWRDKDRLWRERGVNPDLLGERPRNEAEKRLQDRRMHSLGLALDADLCGDDPAIAAALHTLTPMAKH
jgi:hypothetical protein